MRYLPIALALLFLAACQMTGEGRPAEDEMTSSRALEAPGTEVIWVMVEQELERAEFKLDSLHSNPRAGEFETQWVTYASPQRYSGIRRKVVGKIVESPESPGSYIVKLAVWNQRNEDIENPLETSLAKWENQPPETGMAELLIYQIETRLDQ